MATVKTELGITGSGDDALLDRLIAAASRAVVRYTGREFVQETVAETRAGHGDRRMLLTRRPVVSISSVLLTTTTIDAATYSIEDAEAGVIFRKAGWTSTIPIYQAGISGAYAPHDAAPDFTFAYIGGYITPAIAGTRDLPEDVEQACIEMLKARWFARQRDPSLASIKAGDWAETYRGSGGGIPDSAAEMLAPFITHAVGA